MMRVLTLLALGGLLLPALPSRADDQDVIDYRTHIMKTMGEQTRRHRHDPGEQGAAR